MRRPLIIKFGGTSLAGPGRVVRAARRVRAHARRGREVVAVVSAAGRTTDRILERTTTVGAPLLPDTGSGEDARELRAREVDRALATGEDRSAALLALALWRLGTPARSLTGGEAGLVAEGSFGRGRLAAVSPEPLLALASTGVIPVVSGFQARRGDGETITLGRGGSDVSAVALAAALGADCHIVTDVRGVHERDPGLDPDAALLPVLDYEQLIALVEGGARVVHPEAARIAADAAMDLRVYHFRAPLEGTGTRVTAGLARVAGGAS